MYRVVTLAALRSGIDLSNEAELRALVSGLSIKVEAGRCNCNGEEVTGDIRRPEVTEASRFVADSPSVRERLVGIQREFAGGRSVVTEGRDQGTLVFPRAFRKYYLTATAEERARAQGGTASPSGRYGGGV